jgi:hypothetical protein
MQQMMRCWDEEADTILNGLEGELKQHPDYDLWFLAVGFISGVVLTLLVQAVAR